MFHICFLFFAAVLLTNVYNWCTVFVLIFYFPSQLQNVNSCSRRLYLTGMRVVELLDVFGTLTLTTNPNPNPNLNPNPNPHPNY